jgi:hypothetical protein
MAKQNAAEPKTQAQAVTLAELMTGLTIALEGIAEALKRIETAQLAIASQHPPNWRRPLASYTNGWPQAINAFVVAEDNLGPTVVSWMGHIYTRRCGENKKYGAAIWFSRSTGKGENGEIDYARLITFADDAKPQAEPMPEYVVRALQAKQSR